MKVYEAMARAFAEEGANRLFGLMGDGNMAWMTAMAALDEVELFHARHENAAVAMADGFAQTSGQVGICSVTCGPGITQIPTSLTSAARRGTPMVVFAGDTPRAASYHLQHFNPGPLIHSTGALHVPLRVGSSCLDDVQRAFYLARSESMPVVLTAPYDIQEEDYDWEWSYQPSTDFTIPVSDVVPSEGELDVVIQKLLNSQRPVILAGRGAVLAEAREHLLALAEQCGALLSTTLLAKGWFDNEPFDVGLAGAFSTPTARRLLTSSDLVLAFGASLGHYTSEGGYLFSNADIVQIDVAPEGIRQGVPTADIHIRADARRAAEALLKRFEQKPHSQVGFRSEEIQDEIAQGEVHEPPSELLPGKVDPRAALEAIDASIPSDWTVVVGAGHFWNFAVQYLRNRHPSRYLFTAIDFGVVGQGLGAAIGASVARGDGKVALIEGDGSLLMNIQELEMMARHDISLVAMIINDGAYGAEVHKLEAVGIDGSEAIFGAPDLAEVARAFGLSGTRVDAATNDVSQALQKVFSDKKPHIVDFHVCPTVRSAQYRRVFFGEVG